MDMDIKQLANAVADVVFERLAVRASQKFVSVKDYVRQNSIGERTVRRAIAEKRLVTERVGRRVLIPVDARIESR